MTVVYIVLTALYLLITHKFSRAVVADMVNRKRAKEGAGLSVTAWIVSLLWPVWLLIGIANFMLNDKEE